ncbi:hypothetical protein KGQ20_15150 [Catenulispora sp. NF23]|nr:hypothetical protein [Catenulispora pinistramenti]MBS2534109.1 hypothetical protein [Catenulispora pinistramenti]
MPVRTGAGEGDEKAARLGPAAVEHGGRGDRHGGVARDGPADDGGDLAEVEGDHAASQSAAAYCRHIEIRIRGGN